MEALQQLYNLRGNTCSLINSANVTLLPKNDDDALTLVDYRPIRLMHSVAKILTKVLANRLAPHLPSLVSPCQSAFIKGCFIYRIASSTYMGQSAFPPLQDAYAISQT
jgi:hypothetical protein